jgi:hypothetical protein
MILEFHLTGIFRILGNNIAVDCMTFGGPIWEFIYVLSLWEGITDVLTPDIDLNNRL